MSIPSSFNLVLAGDLEELRRAANLLQAAPGDWEMLPIERGLVPEGSYRFRARIWSEEDATQRNVAGDDGILTALREIFPELEIDARFHDEIGYGTLPGPEKEYEHTFDEEDAPEPDAPLIVWSGTPLAPDREAFADRLEAIGMLLLRSVEAGEVGCTLVEDDTTLWSVSGSVADLEYEQVRQLCRELRRLRVPLDTRLERGPRVMSVWPLGQRPWRRVF